MMDTTLPKAAAFCRTILPSHRKSQIQHCNFSIPSCKSNASTTSPSIVPMQIKLPLHKPHHKPPPKPIEPIPRKNTNFNDSLPSCTTSDVLRLMDSLNVSITLDLYVSLIKDCTDTGDPLQAIELCKHFMGGGLRPTLPLLNLFLLMFVSCGCLEHARQLFGKMTVRNLCSWAVMMEGYFENGDHREVVDLFVEMRRLDRTGFGCNYIREEVILRMLVCVFKACVEVMDLELGKQVHSLILKLGWYRNPVLCCSLISFYGRFRCVESSDCVFDGTPNRNKLIWTAKISSCCNEERYADAVHVYKEMRKEGVKKNGSTFSSVLKACGKIKDGGYCVQQVHSDVIKLGLELDGHIPCALVDVYGKHGLIGDARRIFDMNVDYRSASCWNAMVSGYVQQGMYTEALRLSYEMKVAGFELKESLLHELRLVCGGTVFEKWVG